MAAPPTAGWRCNGEEYPCPDSNRGSRFRKPALFPPELQGLALLLFYYAKAGGAQGEF